MTELVVLVVLLVVLVAALTVASHRTWRRISQNRYRFSSRELLLLVALVACACGSVRVLVEAASTTGILFGLGLLGVSLGALIGYAMRGGKGALIGSGAGILGVGASTILIEMAIRYMW